MVNKKMSKGEENEMTEYEKMKTGELFNPADKSFLLPLLRSEILQRSFDRTPLWMQKKGSDCREAFWFLRWTTI